MAIGHTAGLEIQPQIFMWFGATKNSRRPLHLWCIVFITMDIAYIIHFYHIICLRQLDKSTSNSGFSLYETGPEDGRALFSDSGDV
jgi:hypothetical protein